MLCAVTGWVASGDDTVLGVACWSSTGAAADSAFSFLYVSDEPLVTWTDSSSTSGAGSLGL